MENSINILVFLAIVIFICSVCILAIAAMGNKPEKTDKTLLQKEKDLLLEAPKHVKNMPKKLAKSIVNRVTDINNELR